MIRPVHGQVHGLAQERIFGGHRLLFQRYQTLLARFGRIFDQLFHQTVQGFGGIEHDAHQTARRSRENRHGSRDHDRARRSAEHNQRRRKLRDVLEFAAFQQQPAQNASQCEDHAADTGQI